MPRPPLYVSRSDLGWSSTSPAAYADPKSGLVVHYDGSDQGLPDGDLDDFLTYWRNTRAFHTGPSRGWDDIGYSFGASPQGYIVEGRALYRQQAAQPGGNTSHYSVSLGLGPNETPTPEQINAVRALRQWLMEPDTSIAGAVLGHRDFISTSCPGDRAYALVQDGTFTQPPGALTEGLDLLGLKEGDGIPTPSEGVKAVQRLIVAAGFGEHLEPYGVDGQWGTGTSAGLLGARHYVGSGVSSINRMTGESYAQLIRACARREAERAAARVEVPECDCPSGAGAELPATETVEVSGQLTVKR